MYKSAGARCPPLQVLEPEAQLISFVCTEHLGLRSGDEAKRNIKHRAGVSVWVDEKVPVQTENEFSWGRFFLL